MARKGEGTGAGGGERVKLRLVLADQGAFHEEVFSVTADAVAGYERLLDFLQEDPAFLKGCHIDLDRLCSARIVSADD